jgi:spermidine/putrescine transport system permease protein
VATTADERQAIRSTQRARGAFTTIPAAAGMVVFFLVPLLVFAVYSFLSNSLYEVALPFTLDGYRDALSSPVNIALAKNSAWVGLGTAVVTVTLALPIAFWLRRSAGRWRLPVLFLITASLFAGYLVRIYAWRSILGKNGLINSGLQRLGLIDEPLRFLRYSLFSVIVALIHIFLPYAVLVLYGAMGPLGSGIIEAAQDLGAKAPVLWRRVILPIAAAPAVTVFLFVFILSSADYVTPQFLGGISGSTLGVQIQTNFITLGNWPLAAATSFLMMTAFVSCYFLSAMVLRVAGLRDVRFVN